MTAHSEGRPAPLLRTPVCDLLGITHPVILGGMGTGTSAGLVAAVSNGGGLGTLGISARTPAEVREETARIRERTTAPFGLNLLLFYRNDAALDATLELRPSVMAFAWPAADQALKGVFARAHAAGAQVMHMVSRVTDAVRAAEAGAVCAVRDYEHVISLARQVMLCLPHVLLAGAGAERFAGELGMERRALLTAGAKATFSGKVGREVRRRYRTLRDLVRAATQDPQIAASARDYWGTVDVIARDRDGNIASGVSTSGWAWKYPGRVGDSPIIGAGNYADNR